MIFENSLPKANFGQNIRDSPNGSLTADSRSLQTATLKSCEQPIFQTNVWISDKNSIELVIFSELLYNRCFHSFSRTISGKSQIGSLTKHPTFSDGTTGFPAKWRLRSVERNSILMTRHCQELEVKLLIGWTTFPPGSTNQKHYPVLGSYASSICNFCMVVSSNCRLFSDQAIRNGKFVYFNIEFVKMLR